jgi:hypothetical protein
VHSAAPAGDVGRVGRHGVTRRSLVRTIAGIPATWFLLPSAGMAAACSSSTPVTSKAAARPGDRVERADEFLARVLDAISTEPSAIITVRRPGSAAPTGWTATGPVRYAADQVHALLRVRADDGRRQDVLVSGRDVYTKRHAEWTRVTTKVRPGSLGFGHELRTSVQLLGQAAGTPSATFTRRPNRLLPATWVASLNQTAWLQTLPRAARSQFAAVTSFDVQVLLDENGRPERRIDSIQPNSLLITMDVTWTDWGTTKPIPAKP